MLTMPVVAVYTAHLAIATHYLLSVKDYKFTRIWTISTHRATAYYNGG